MRRNRKRIFIALLLGITAVQTACAQQPGISNQQFLSQTKDAANATVLLNNEKGTVPLMELDKSNIAAVHFSYNYSTVFDSLANKYAKVTPFNGNNYLGKIASLGEDLKLYNTVIFELTESDINNPALVSLITSFQSIKKVVVAYYGAGRALSVLNGVTAPIIWTDKTTPVTAQYLPQVAFGGVATTQKLKSSFSSKYNIGAGFSTAKIRLQYTVPEDVGINSNNLANIDAVAMEAIANHAAPGCVVLVAKDGKVIFNKAYGTHTYDAGALPEKVTDIFDMASVTKVSATTPTAMALYEQGKLDLDGTMGQYLTIARATNKNDIKVRELLTHTAGLTPYIPFYEHVKPGEWSADSSAAYPTKVADGYYMIKDYYKNFMLPQMLNSALRTRGNYVYSDLSMYFMKEIEETITSTPLNIYAQQNFYTPLGMQTAGFLPRQRFTRNQIVPTEDDTYFRHTLLVGYVHDQGAGMVGGVSGHAGYFCSANDEAILFQMLLNKGTYGGVQYFKPETVEKFTTRQSQASRRDLGFDGWGPIAESHYPSHFANEGTYGHTGYTGTCVWVDPKVNLVYIFLSNRVNPKVTDKLLQLNIRPRIMDTIYEAIAKGM
ncbi:serine hydrolase domain-containing protein [Mucilaginibacter ginkgonis]|uniref:Serine hydrolase n=1 Tax=Mucilaginibacter ginkgonis TaxID=2682091 RepID=A0A6I4HXQ8_9SPHI|nr:serine hydrolase [Mucilaginibacter ginkgonis]QQL49450.1 serine hydrolase [Mucilaginibacter ginkgonis]